MRLVIWLEFIEITDSSFSTITIRTKLLITEIQIMISVMKEPKPPSQPKPQTETKRKSPGKSPTQNGGKKGKKKKKGPHIDPPPPEMVLKYPIEVWISSGENFVKPESKCCKCASLYRKCDNTFDCTFYAIIQMWKHSLKSSCSLELRGLQYRMNWRRKNTFLDKCKVSFSMF